MDLEWAERVYDEVVTSGGSDGLKLEYVRAEFARRYEEAIDNGELAREIPSLHIEGERYFERLVSPLRERRKTKLINDMEYILDSLNDETILGRAYKPLTQAYKLGNGSDKILLLWSIDDWMGTTLERYQKAAEATAAASRFDELATQIISAMKSRNAVRVSDLFNNSIFPYHHPQRAKEV